MTWVTPEVARALNADLAALEDDELVVYLDAAFEACAAFLPDGVDYSLPEAATASRKLAQVLQAKAQWQAQRVGRDNGFGDGDVQVTVFPLDWNVRQLLRPKRGRPVIR